MGECSSKSNLEQNLECPWNDLGIDLERLEFWSGTARFWLRNTWNSGIMYTVISDESVIREQRVEVILEKA